MIPTGAFLQFLFAVHHHKRAGTAANMLLCSCHMWHAVYCCAVCLQVRLPVRCEALLRLLLECIRGASSKYQLGGRDGSSNALRAEMYVCLIQYMHFCRWVQGACSAGWCTCALQPHLLSVQPRTTCQAGFGQFGSCPARRRVGHCMKAKNCH